jgi:signal transduction histidine kinase
VKVKAHEGYLWIMQDRGLQLLDMQTDQIIDNFEFPEVSGANIYDVYSTKDTALLATNEGLYKIALRPSKRYLSLNSMLRLVVVNQKDTISSTSVNLKYDQNDIKFHLAVPWYSTSNSLYYKYRLNGVANSYQWLTTQPGERFIRFASLMPGSYTFEAYAVVAGFQEKKPVTFHFTIAKPWWQTSLFAIFVISLIAAGFFAIYRMRFRQVLQLEQVRRTISSDLHDEIGSTISSINIYSELAKSERQNEVYLKLIQENTRDVISKLDDLVWSINPKNDSVHQLLARMQSFAEPVLTGAGIHPHFSTEEEVIKQELSLEKKRNLYLSFKELVNNVVRHSNARNCYIEMAMHSNKIILTITDDGIGFEAAATDKDRSGMFNLKERARSTGSTFTLDGAPGKGTRAVLAVPLK